MRLSGTAALHHPRAPSRVNSIRYQDALALQGPRLIAKVT